MAEPFATLGDGCGFPEPLTEFDAGNGIVLNAPTLEQTMNAYWNFKSATFGAATFEPGNEPKDLICNQNANVGSASSGDGQPNQGGSFTVRNSLPAIFVSGGVKYYKHGIRMYFQASTSVEENGGGRGSSIYVSYFSALYTVQTSPALQPYSCYDETYCPEGIPPCMVIGKGASEVTQTQSSVTIGGIPFIKQISKSFGGTFYPSSPPGPCPQRDYPAEPGAPSLTLHTYESS
tara:strand:- start:293 stop:991 length:699 start_codon:yes stop_codon:yes gene_type:complete